MDDIRPNWQAKRIFVMVSCGVAMMLLGLLQYLNWNSDAPITLHDYNTVVVCVLIFALALSVSKTQAPALLFAGCAAQLFLALKMNSALSDLYNGWGKTIPFDEYADKTSTAYAASSLGTAGLGFLFVVAVYAMERDPK